MTSGWNLWASQHPERRVTSAPRNFAARRLPHLSFQIPQQGHMRVHVFRPARLAMFLNMASQSSIYVPPNEKGHREVSFFVVNKLRGVCDQAPFFH